jgi:hypothetical protein
MENTKNVEMEDVTIVDELTEEKVESKSLDIDFSMVPVVGVLGAVKQLASKETYAIGAVAGLLRGRKAGLKTIGAIVIVGGIWNAARYATGEFRKKD